jgi:hypothetical protein
MLTAILCLTMTQVPEVDFSKSYLGKDGQMLELVFLKPKKAQQALIRVSKSNSVFDDVVFRASIKEGRGTDFVIRYRGGDYFMVVQRNEMTTVNVPENKEFVVKFSETATKEMKPESLVEGLEKQKESTALLARKEWVFLEKKYSTKAQALSETLSKKCKSDVKINFNWASFPDEIMAEIDVWPLCAGLEQLNCATMKSNPQLTCQLGTNMGFEKGVFTTTKEGAKNGSTFVKGIK